MRLFLNHVLDSLHMIRDLDGQEFSDVHAAEQEAVLGIRAICADRLGLGLVAPTGHVEITTSTGEVVSVLAYSHALHDKIYLSHFWLRLLRRIPDERFEHVLTFPLRANTVDEAVVEAWRSFALAEKLLVDAWLAAKLTDAADRVLWAYEPSITASSSAKNALAHK